MLDLGVSLRKSYNSEFAALMERILLLWAQAMRLQGHDRGRQRLSSSCTTVLMHSPSYTVRRSLWGELDLQQMSVQLLCCSDFRLYALQGMTYACGLRQGGQRRGSMPTSLPRNPQTLALLAMLGLPYNLDPPSGKTEAMSLAHACCACCVRTGSCPLR